MKHKSASSVWGRSNYAANARLIAKREDAEAYLAEARTVANLDLPGIMPVQDVGSTDDYRCCVVSKYIEGTDHATKLKQKRLKYREAAELIAPGPPERGCRHDACKRLQAVLKR